jgi:hypothetical protein
VRLRKIFVIYSENERNIIPRGIITEKHINGKNNVLIFYSGCFNTNLSKLPYDIFRPDVIFEDQVR